MTREHHPPRARNSRNTGASSTPPAAPPEPAPHAPDAPTSTPDTSAQVGGSALAQTPDDAWALVGVIVGAFGLHGDLKLRPETNFPERFTHTKTLYVGDDHTPYPVASARPHKADQLVIHLTGIETATEAERMRSRRVFVPLVELTPLAPDQFYIHDLIGLRVEHVNGTLLGEIVDVITTGASDLYVVRRTETPGAAGKKASANAEVLLPAVKEFVKAISLARGVVVVDPIPGLFDDASDDTASDDTASD